jgi:molybdopterin-containing oxidoreductase family membrane subunit
LRVTVIANIFLVLAEVFTHFYTGGHHAHSSEYLFLGLEGAHGLVPWIWTGLVLNVSAALILLFGGRSSREKSRRLLLLACGMVFVGVWIEKGMGLIVPGFVPSTLGEIVEYSPSLTEWKITAGIWAFGLAVLTVALRITATVFRGELGSPSSAPHSSKDVDAHD